MTQPYTAGFYTDQAPGSLRSARRVVPDILDLIAAQSVVDVGCGVGTWLSIYGANGVGDIQGIDGPWVDPRRVLIPGDRFMRADLQAGAPMRRRFDLAQSLEVAEHLPASAAPNFVGALTALADVIVFSAAIPHQGGTHHINERWPSYWRALFKERGFTLYDVFRARYWDAPDVEWWYAQNLFLYVKSGCENRLTRDVSGQEGFVLPEKMVHPHRIDPVRNPIGLKALLGETPRALRRTLARRVSSRALPFTDSKADQARPA